MYWEKDVETKDRGSIEAFQLSRFNEIVKTARKSPYYHKLFLDIGLNSDRINSLESIKNIPFTTKDDLRENWPYGLLTVPKDEVIRMHASSGTTGRATVVFHTARDIQAWANVLARCVYMAGMRKGDVFQNMMSYGLFTGGLGFHYAAEKVGALVIPAGAGNSKRQIQLMRDFETTVIHIIPSYALHLSRVFEELHVDPRNDTKLRIAFIGAEPHSEKMRRKIEEIYGIKAFNSYGLSEMNGPGVSFECPYQNGMHIWEDHYFVEIIDPNTLKAAPEGEEGELVLTTLMREGMPIIRYRTKDLTRIIPGQCACGRTHRRIDRIKGRTDDMMIVKGVNIFPIQVEKKLMEIPGVGTNFVIILERAGYDDTMIVKVEVQNELFAGEAKQRKSLKKRIVDELRADILITPKVELVGPGKLPSTEGKALRVIDNRKE